MPAPVRDNYERLVEVIRQELAPLNLKLDRLEATMENKHYTREAVDGMRREDRTRMDALEEEVKRQAQSWQVLLTRVAAWAGLGYVLLQIATHLSIH